MRTPTPLRPEPVGWVKGIIPSLVRDEVPLKVEVDANPEFGHLAVSLSPGKKILCESGAMSAMDVDVQSEVQMMGGFIPALMRKLLAGESLMAGVYSSSREGARIFLAPGIPGEVREYDLSGRSLMMTAGSYLACEEGVTLGTRFGGLQAIFSGEGMFFIEATGNGRLWFNSYGAIIEKDIDGTFVVDTGHLVAWEPGLTWNIGKVGNWFSTFFSGEGLVMKFEGRGKIWLQTRSLDSIASWLSGYCIG